MVVYTAPSAATHPELLEQTRTEAVVDLAGLLGTYRRQLLAEGFGPGESWWLLQSFMLANNMAQTIVARHVAEALPQP